MKIKDHPQAKRSYVKDFERETITHFLSLSEEQREYTITGLCYKTICGRKEKVFIIASDNAMKEWGLKPRRYRYSPMDAMAEEVKNNAVLHI